MTLYADENDVNFYLYNTFGIDILTGDLAGSSSWVNVTLSEKTTESSLSFLAADETISVSDGSIYKAGMYLKNGTELIFIKSISLNVLTVLRGFQKTTTIDGTSLIILTSADRVRACIDSTEEINDFHGQTNGDYLFLADSLLDAAAENALELLRLRCAIETNEFVKTLASQNYSDGVLSIGSMGNRFMSKKIINKIRQVLSDNDYEFGVFQRR